ncbi:hypothetical protein LptCag_0341 [Leptospirillum ferriphilum]|uniref:Uncharacterized protein n=1 Tax=Leptospirillum ferriphilum TaxID=178606 RepID=A0A094W9V3_9BACT|nr:hypothetical protein LptCag_0341 [Leptospirillum ferriphilum]
MSGAGRFLRHIFSTRLLRILANNVRHVFLRAIRKQTSVPVLPGCHDSPPGLTIRSLEQSRSGCFRGIPENAHSFRKQQNFSVEISERSYQTGTFGATNTPETSRPDEAPEEVSFLHQRGSSQG